MPESLQELFKYCIGIGVFTGIIPLAIVIYYFEKKYSNTDIDWHEKFWFCSSSNKLVLFVRIAFWTYVLLLLWSTFIFLSLCLGAILFGSYSISLVLGSIGRIFLRILGYFFPLCLLGGGIWLLYFISKEIVVGIQELLKKHEWLDEKLMSIIGIFFSGGMIILFVLFVVIAAAKSLLSGGFSAIVRDDIKDQHWSDENFIRVVTNRTDLLNFPEVNGKKVGGLPQGNYVLLLFSYSRGISPVNGYQPCLIIGRENSFQKGWVDCKVLRIIEIEKEKKEFRTQYIKSVLSSNSLKEILISAVISSFFCLLLSIVFGATIAHYSTFVGFVVTVLTTALKYGAFGIGAVPPVYAIPEIMAVGTINTLVLKFFSIVKLKVSLN